MAQNQDTVAGPIKMDSRKFLSALNESAQSKVAFFESKIAQMGAESGKNWELVGLRIKQVNRDNMFSGDLFIENVDDHTYSIADFRKVKGGKIYVENIRPIQISDTEKNGIFENSCYQLINAIEANDQKSMSSAFSKMAAQRFSGKVIPSSGVVTTKDGQTRHIAVNNGSVTESVKPKLVAAIVENLIDRVTVNNGNITEGVFNDGSNVKLPVNKWTTRKLVGRRMREAAQNAYWSQGFQNRVYDLSTKVYEGKLSEAIEFIKPFLQEKEEFTLLNRKEVKSLVENALAAKGCFNDKLCEDTATLFYKVNLKVNKDTIIKEWKNIAIKTEQSAMLENVHTLSESKDFEGVYDKFIYNIFEAISNRDVTAKALATTLDVLKNNTPRIKESHELSSRLDDLIGRLSGPDCDDSSIYEAEDLIATIHEELSAHQNLQNFDSTPGDDVGLGGEAGFDNDDLGLADEDLGDDDFDAAADADNGKQPVININAPLISIGSTNSGSPDAEFDDELGDDEFGDEEGMGEDGLGDEGLEAGPRAGTDDFRSAGSAAAGGAFGEGRLPSKKKAINEWEKPWEKDESDSDDSDSDSDSDDDSDSDSGSESDDSDSDAGSCKPWEDDCNMEESVDQYFYNSSNKPRSMADYGTPAITSESALSKIAGVMKKLAVENRLTGKLLNDNLRQLAEASLASAGVTIPDRKKSAAVNQVVKYFVENVTTANLAAPPLPMDSCDVSADEDEEDDVAEDKMQRPRIKKMGILKTEYPKDKTSSEGTIQWVERGEYGVKGVFRDIPFILDWADNMPLAVLNETGSYQVDVPHSIQESAYGCVGMVDADSKPFVKWLSQNIEQLRDISEDEELAIQEATTTIKVGPDGVMTVDVQGDVEVNEVPDDEVDGIEGDGELDAVGGEMGDDVGGVDDAEAGGEMKPVDSIVAPTDVPSDGDESSPESMPNFDGDDDGADSDVVGGESDDENLITDVEGDEDEEGFAEDNDMTTPKQDKYSKHVEEDPRADAKAKTPNKPGDKLEGIGPSTKEDDGTGTKPPISKKNG